MGINLGVRISGAQAVGDATGPLITAPGSLAPGNFKVGAVETITPGTATATGGGAITYESRFLDDGSLVSSTTTHTYLSASYGNTGVAQWRAVETGGTNDGATNWQTVGSAAITDVAPTVASPLGSQVLSQGTGLQSVITTGVFTGLGVVQNGGALPAGVTFDATEGAERYIVDTTNLLANTAMTLTGINLDGSAIDNWSLEVAGVVPFELVITGDNRFEITGATGLVTIDVDAPPEYATYDAGSGPGVFQFNAPDLASGPVALVPAQIIDDGTPEEGETLTLTPGLWVNDGDLGGIGTPAYQWQRDTGGGFADISGATSNSYTLAAADAGNDVRVQESLSDSGGSRTSNSAPVSVAGGGVTAPTRLDALVLESRGANTTTLLVPTPYTVPAGTDRLLVGILSWRNPSAASTPSMTFGGTPMTLAGLSHTAVPQFPASAIFTMPEADIQSGAQQFFVDYGLSANGLTLHVMTYSGVDQTTPTGTFAVGTLAPVSTSYDVSLTTAANSALVAFGTSLENVGTTPTTVSGDATELLESLGPGNSRAMLITASNDNTTAGAKTVIFTPDTDGQQAIAAAIEVFGQ